MSSHQRKLPLRAVVVSGTQLRNRCDLKTQKQKVATVYCDCAHARDGLPSARLPQPYLGLGSSGVSANCELRPWPSFLLSCIYTIWELIFIFGWPSQPHWACDLAGAGFGSQHWRQPQGHLRSPPLGLAPGESWPADDGENRARVWENSVSELSQVQEMRSSLFTGCIPFCQSRETNEEQVGSSINWQTKLSEST